MYLADIVFLAGPVGAVAVVPAVVALLAVARRPRWAVWLTASLSAGVGLTWLSYWVLWGKAFDYADAFQPVPAPLEAALNTTMTLCAGGVVLLGATAIAFALFAVSRRVSLRIPG